MWSDKYKPKDFDELRDSQMHDNIFNMVENLCQSNDVPHLLIHGCAGVGKTTLLHAIIRTVYGSDTINSQKPHKTTVDKTQIIGVESNCHFEFHASTSQSVEDDRVLLATILQFSKTKSLQDVPFHAICIKHADLMSQFLQQGLLKLMETEMAHTRFFLTCKSMTKLTKALRSRIFAIRIPAPHPQMIYNFLLKILQTETVPTATCENEIAELLNNIITIANGDIGVAIDILQHSLTCKTQLVEKPPPLTIMKPDWKQMIQYIAKKIFEEPTRNSLANIRAVLDQLLETKIPSTIIFELLLHEILKMNIPTSKDITIKNNQLIRLAAFYEHRACIGNNPIFHIEAFVAKAMCIL